MNPRLDLMMLSRSSSKATRDTVVEVFTKAAKSCSSVTVNKYMGRMWCWDDKRSQSFVRYFLNRIA